MCMCVCGGGGGGGGRGQNGCWISHLRKNLVSRALSVWFHYDICHHVSKRAKKKNLLP